MHVRCTDAREKKSWGDGWHSPHPSRNGDDGSLGFVCYCSLSARCSTRHWQHLASAMGAAHDEEAALKEQLAELQSALETIKEAEQQSNAPDADLLEVRHYTARRRGMVLLRLSV